MRRNPIAALGVLLALGPASAFAAAGDIWHGSNRYQEYAPLEVTRPTPDHVVIYETRSYDTAPIVVERSYTYEPGYVYYYEPRTVYLARVDDDWVKDLNPETGQRIGDGLFNKRGPNDFGN